MPSSAGNGASAQRYISYGPRIARIFPIPALSPHAMMPAALLPPTPTTSFLSGSRTGLAGDRLVPNTGGEPNDGRPNLKLDEPCISAAERRRPLATGFNRWKRCILVAQCGTHERRLSSLCD